MLCNLKLFNTLTSLSRRIYSESLDPKRQCLIRHLVAMSYQRHHKLKPHKGERRSTERQTDRRHRAARVMQNVCRYSSWMGHEAYHNQWRRCRSRNPLCRSTPTLCWQVTCYIRLKRCSVLNLGGDKSYRTINIKWNAWNLIVNIGTLYAV
jgi:hypothetical protein